jgi:hypothetical protein
MSSAPDTKAIVDDVDIEKKVESVEVHEVEKLDSYTVDTSQGDEALQLVGVERKERFSDEYNLKLRRKLVRLSLKRSLLWSNRYSGSSDPTNLCSSLLHAVLVSGVVLFCLVTLILYAQRQDIPELCQVSE